jgi:hypothetical protein
MSQATYDQECRFDQHLGWYQSCLLDGEEIAKLFFKPDRAPTNGSIEGGWDVYCHDDAVEQTVRAHVRHQPYSSMPVAAAAVLAGYNDHCRSGPSDDDLDPGE